MTKPRDSRRRPWRRCSSCFGICHWHDEAWVCRDCGDEWYPYHGARYAAPVEHQQGEPMIAEVLGVQDHGVWRGRRSWTIRLRDERGVGAVSTHDVTNEEDAIAQARETFANRLHITSEEREAVRRANAALGKWSRSR
jgi:hypothetical protein